MSLCPHCSGNLPPESRFCPVCGSAVVFADTHAETVLGAEEVVAAGEGPIPTPDPLASGLSSSSVDGGRFLPGTVLAGRYRIIGLLGRGGMGEVYRADDLKLGQAVALKFLPREVERDEDRLQLFLNEVRVSLRVTHPNVCRVYDLGEVDQQHYISMEFVDGEDLASLLRRIGRLPRDKALEIAHQLCAGLAAAHDQGILHRDLKPANVMIDGRGRVRITDFGLASLVTGIQAGEVRVGTPAYMAPEQLAGTGVSARSDVYALGLVLFELFTGHKAFEADSVAELVRLQQDSGFGTPSSFVDGFDPVIERVLLRCLEQEPMRRPRSALAVASSLPGGDPLAAAIAAGETPSPEIVAQAGDVGGLEPRTAWACLGAVAVGLLLAFSWDPLITHWVSLEKSPEVLQEKAREILQGAGYTDPARDSTFGFRLNEGYLTHLEESEATRERWQPLARERPPGMLFWYRQSPRDLERRNQATVNTESVDPPATVSGMVIVELDPQGRLYRLEAVPPERVEGEGPASEVAWETLFQAAGMEMGTFTSVEAEWSPESYADRRLAWEGVFPGDPETTIRVEGASFHGLPISFRVVEPWSRPERQEHPKETGVARAVRTVGSGFPVLALAGGLLLAWRNLRLGRGDRRGAFRFALYFLVARMAVWLFGMNDLLEPSWSYSFLANLAWALFRFGIVWVFYLALEPYLRKIWPETMVSWVRILRGRWRDPLVGRDVLLGCLSYVVLIVSLKVVVLAGGWLSVPPVDVRPDALGLEALRGLRHAASMMIFSHAQLLFRVGVFSLAWLLLMRLLLRKTWIAAGVWCLTLLVVADPFGGADQTIAITLTLVWLAWWLLVFFRFGLLPLLVGLSLAGLTAPIALTLDPSRWYSAATYLGLAIALALAAYGFYISVAGRPLFRDELQEI